MPLKETDVVLISSVSFANPAVIGVKATIIVKEAPGARVTGSVGPPVIENGLLIA